jgi:hypothetical protein
MTDRPSTIAVSPGPRHVRRVCSKSAADSASDDVTPEERDVLCRFLLQGLNDWIQAGTPHPLQTAIFDALLEAEATHRAELAYGMDTSDPDSDNWWPITAELVRHKRARS